ASTGEQKGQHASSNGSLQHRHTPDPRPALAKPTVPDEDEVCTTRSTVKTADVGNPPRGRRSLGNFGPAFLRGRACPALRSGRPARGQALASSYGIGVILLQRDRSLVFRQGLSELVLRLVELSQGIVWVG